MSQSDRDRDAAIEAIEARASLLSSVKFIAAPCPGVSTLI